MHASRHITSNRKGRDELETLLGSPYHSDWITISERFLGPVSPNFWWEPKHKSGMANG